MKTCSTCKEIKSLNCFAKKTRNKDGYQDECKGCRKTYQEQWYQSNKIAHKKNVAIRNKRIVDELKQVVHEYKMSHPCEKCGFDHPGALQFHHLDQDDKECEVSVLIIRKVSVQRIMQEIEKCQVLCANCHSILHYNERMERGLNGEGTAF